MDFKRIKDLLTFLGVSLAYKGHPYTVYLIWLASGHTGLVTMPLMKDLCEQTAAYFHVSRTVVEDDVRTMLNAYWNQQENAERFRAVTGYPVIDRLTTKEFIFAVACYLARETQTTPSKPTKTEPGVCAKTTKNDGCAVKTLTRPDQKR